MAKKNENLITRPPVVVIMGHIDCGKTSLLDKIRKTSIQEKESGGITQHIGAYQVEKDGKKITFIDTPGHEAFCQMRSRGAETADIAILVIDSCKGVQDQTKEVIDCIKAVNIPTIVAFNKMDKPAANPNKAKSELQQKDILVESLGGEVPSVDVSAITGDGINDVLASSDAMIKSSNLDLSILKKMSLECLNIQNTNTYEVQLIEYCLRVASARSTLDQAFSLTVEELALLADQSNSEINNNLKSKISDNGNSIFHGNSGQYIGKIRRVKRLASQYVYLGGTMLSIEIIPAADILLFASSNIIFDSVAYV